jgi:hypothetical protein
LGAVYGARADWGGIFARVDIRLALLSPVTANDGTEGTGGNVPVWDIFKEFLITLSVLNRFG